MIGPADRSAGRRSARTSPPPNRSAPYLDAPRATRRSPTSATCRAAAARSPLAHAARSAAVAAPKALRPAVPHATTRAAPSPTRDAASEGTRAPTSTRPRAGTQPRARAPATSHTTAAASQPLPPTPAERRASAPRSRIDRCAESGAASVAAGLPAAAARPTGHSWSLPRASMQCRASSAPAATGQPAARAGRRGARGYGHGLPRVQHQRLASPMSTHEAPTTQGPPLKSRASQTAGRPSNRWVCPRR